MKKTFLVVLLFLVGNSIKAQYSNFFAINPAVPYYVYVGSLRPSDAGNYEKLKVDIFGGGWESESIGETTYYIANRDVLTASQVVLGSSNGNRFTLKAYDNSSNGLLDFYVITNNWAVMSIKSYLSDWSNNSPSPQLMAIAQYTSLPQGLTEHPLTVIPVINTDGSGNMAFGTNTIDPNFKLSVNGSIRAKEIKVETGWADYVFDKDYVLKPLKEVEDYINQNKHLPDVPSTAEVEKNGIKVGETEALLMKKVEELTLYLIEKDKEISNQKEVTQKLIWRIESLESKLK